MKKLMMAVMVAALGVASAQAITIQEWCEALTAADQCVNERNWSRATYWMGRVLEGNGLVPVNMASNHLCLFFLNWNLDEKDDAIANLRKCIQILDNQLGNNCSERAKTLLEKVRAGKVRGSFTPKDINAGLHNFIMEIPWAVNERKHQQVMARYDALMGQISASTDVYRKQGEMQAWQAKFYAKRDYEKKHHRTFDPDDRPSEDSGRREDWDACKRIYDIFGD